MTWRKRVSKQSAKKALRVGALTLFTAQALAASAIIAVDEHRKRRYPQSGEFPHMSPKSAKVEGNDLTVYTFGEDLYDDMIEAIESATDHIYFETYIMKADKVGYRFRNALIAAAERGVHVYIILDTLGNLNQNPFFRRFPDLETLHVIRFPLLRLWLITLNSKDSGFDHRKILVVDKHIGFVGGYNIGSLYANHWRDTHVRIIGDATWELENAFTDMWNVYRDDDQPRLPDSGTRVWTSRVAGVQNVPAFRSYPIRTRYLDVIDRASERIWITMAYFIPDHAIKKSLTSAAERGVDVRILIPQYSNHILTDWVGRQHYTELLESGCRIFLYEDAMVHAKTMTVDSAWLTVGTANLDRLSMMGNMEVNLEVFDEASANLLEEVFDLDMTNAHELSLEDWNNRSHLARVSEWLMKPFGPLL